MSPVNQQAPAEKLKSEQGSSRSYSSGSATGSGRSGNFGKKKPNFKHSKLGLAIASSQSSSRNSGSERSLDHDETIQVDKKYSERSSEKDSVGKLSKEERESQK